MKNSSSNDLEMEGLKSSGVIEWIFVSLFQSTFLNLVLHWIQDKSVRMQFTIKVVAAYQS